jgi:hypothetical protein
VNLALFDFDGTITFGDTWTPFMRLAVKPARQTFGRFLLVPAYASYKCGMMPVGGMRESAIRIGLRRFPLSYVRAQPNGWPGISRKATMLLSCQRL